MDTLRGQFDPADFSEDLPDFDSADDLGAPEPPPSPIGQDERRMQVRAYNHWAGLLGDRNYPSIEDLQPENLTDFGPYSVLLDFTGGIEDPAVRYVGAELAAECDATDGIVQLSDVPARSLLSRITDHYMQILANQAPIGFEAEFVNQRGITILYRGILLPYSSDNETIDFIYGVINWKELADQQTTDELMLEIDQALEGVEEVDLDAEDSNVLDLSSFGGGDLLDDGREPIEERLPRPTFGSLLTPEGFEDDEDDDEEYALPAGWSLSDPNDPDEDGEYADDSADVYDDDYDPESDEDEEDDGIELGLSRLIENEFERAERKPIDLAALGIEGEAIDYDASDENAHDFAHGFKADDEGVSEFAVAENFAPAKPVEAIDEAEELQDDDAFAEAAAYDLEEAIELEGEVLEDDELEVEQIATAFEPDYADDTEDDFAFTPSPDSFGLYDCLAEARELAQAARSCEDRSRHALYAAVGRAYDVSLAAIDTPEDYNELLDENGLTVQDRAPMTPVVKLVFGADYDKTRLTEYAAVLTHAHRVGIERGQLAAFLIGAEGGLKGVVNAERRLRREEAGKPVEAIDAVRASLAAKLRKLEGSDLADIAVEGSEFALVMIRRTEDGDIVVLGEIGDDVPLIERAARKILG